MPTHPTKLLDQARAREVGHETLAILRRGAYLHPSGGTVEIADAVGRAREGTVTYPPDRAAALPRADAFSPSIEVRNETTLEAVRRLVLEGRRPVALNFASAVNPGGGWLHGARAQEESLVRSSALHACLEGNPMYEFHRLREDPLYTDWVIYSPDVPVFRLDDGRVLDEPYACSFLTSPAPYRRAIEADDTRRLSALETVFRWRIAKVLAVGRAHGHQTIVLGAWGCGAFGNDPVLVARLFEEALGGAFRGAYREVRFAIYDAWEDHRTIGPFLARFGR